MQLNITVVIAILSSAVTANPKGSSDADSSVMSCLNELDSQLTTLLWVPDEILLLRHRVFREYAKIAVGPDFVHTLPSFVIIAAAFVLLWKHPPSLVRPTSLVGANPIYKSFQVLVSWLVVTVLLWLWLVLQRILYCSVWHYWSYKTEHRDISYTWWERVWSSYYPAPVQPPVMSACFISWIIAMSVSIIALGWAINGDRSGTLVRNTSSKFWNALAAIISYLPIICRYFISCEIEKNEEDEEETDNNDDSRGSICDNYDGRPETATDMSAARGEIHPISYGTNWTPPPNFSKYKEAQRKISMKSFHTVTGVNDVQDPDKFMAKQFRPRRSCHTMIPGNFSEQSSGHSRD